MKRDLGPLLLCALIVTGSVSTVHAAQRTFVASNGVDSQPCTIALPCRSFQAAITAVLSGAAPNGSVIDVQPGIYHESLLINTVSGSFTGL